MSAKAESHGIPDHAVLFQFKAEVPAITAHGAAAGHFNITGQKNRLRIGLSERGKSLQVSEGAARLVF